MNDPHMEFLRKMNRQQMRTIWECAKHNELDELTEEEKLYARTMLEHQDEFFNEFEFGDVMDEYEYDPDTEVNPFAHITIHVVVENQLQAKDPIEVLHFYHAMRRKKLSHHDTIHLIGSIMIPFIFYSLKQKREFDTESYKHLLRK